MVDVKFPLPDVSGVLPSQWLQKAISCGVVRSPVYAFDEAQIQPASLDLRLGDCAYRLRCSFLPSGRTVGEMLPQFTMDKVDLRDGAVLERNRPYLIPLAESLYLPPGLAGRANPKSSTGRLDIFTRVITDRSPFFDDIPPGYQGNLYLEVFSRSFTIRVMRGLALNQLRLMSASPTVSDDELKALHSEMPLLYLDERPVPVEKLPLDDGLFLSLAVGGDNKHQEKVGWRAKKNSALLDLTATRAHNPAGFWEKVRSEDGGGIILEPEEFYLLLSRERVRVPPHLAAEMIAYDPTSGELRTHYAGFFDPGFGHSGSKLDGGSHAALEVRAHDVPFLIQGGQRVCKLSFERLVEQPDMLYGTTSSHYQFQAGALSKHFYPLGVVDKMELAHQGDAPADDLTMPLFDVSATSLSRH